MYDINFFRKYHQLKLDILAGKHKNTSKEEIFKLFESFRNPKPYVFNLETTNNCNMRCVMCPRTNLMTRSIETMDMELFRKIVSQVQVHTEKDLQAFDAFVQKTYGVFPEDENENGFYFYISSRHLTLHGFGEPLIDPLLVKRIDYCSQIGVPTYFSCVPANINVKKITELMKAGAGVIKFSIDALDDGEQKRIRGKYNNFSEAYRKILKVLEIKAKNNYKTKIVVTLIALSDDEDANRTKKEFLELWSDAPVYSYVKSQDNRWLYEEDQNLVNRSHYEAQYCEFPWMSMTVMADGSVVPCTQDYDLEINLGNVKHHSLEEIWNNVKFRELRHVHLSGSCANIKCTKRCDQKLVFEKRLDIQKSVSTQPSSKVIDSNA